MHKKNRIDYDGQKYKTRGHCHFTGKYRGAADNTQNLRYKIPKKIHVVFHNGSKYDCHIIIKELLEEFECQCALNAKEIIKKFLIKI